MKVWYTFSRKKTNQPEKRIIIIGIMFVAVNIIVLLCLNKFADWMMK